MVIKKKIVFHVENKIDLQIGDIFMVVHSVHASVKPISKTTKKNQNNSFKKKITEKEICIKITTMK